MKMRKGLKFAVVATILLFLVGGVFVVIANQTVKADSNQPTNNPYDKSVQMTPPPPGNPDELPAPPYYINGRYINPEFQKHFPDISDEEWKRIGEARAAAIRARSSRDQSTAPPPVT